MKIGVVADTHSRDLPDRMMNDFKDVDLIVHAGDFATIDVLEAFKKLKDVRAVFGNMDERSIREVLPKQDIFDADGLSVGVVHGKGAPKDVVYYAKEVFEKDKVDIVIFGHAHLPFNEEIDGVLYFCPGSPTDYVTAPYCSYGIITIENGKASGEIIEVDL